MPRLGLLAIVLFLLALATVVSPAEAMNPIMMQYIGLLSPGLDVVLTLSVTNAHGSMRRSPRCVRDELLIAWTPRGPQPLDEKSLATTIARP